MTHCPRCHQPLHRSTLLIPGLVVLGCRNVCRTFAVEPPDGIDWEWLEGGPGLVDRLKESHERATRTVAIRQSDDDDPRWQEVMG
jgi:hypothetical protein